ncbi:hypothetical protein K439DRAFT_1253540, partial [Ramaria rubella]
SYNIPPDPSPELQTALKWIDGFNCWDIDQITSVLSNDYTHHILPKTLGVKSRNKEEFREYFTGILPMFQDFKVTIHEIVEGAGKLVIHASSTATSTTGYPYANEYNLILHLVSQGEGLPKISMIKEFVDSKFAVEFFVGERKRQAE